MAASWLYGDLIEEVVCRKMINKVGLSYELVRMIILKDRHPQLVSIMLNTKLVKIARGHVQWGPIAPMALF